MMKEAKTGYLCIAALLTMWPSRAVASEPLPPKAGVLVRITAPTMSPVPVIGTLIESDDRGLTLVTIDAVTLTLPRDAVTRMEWSSGRRSQSGPFALKGAIAVGSAFAVVGALVNGDDSGERVRGAAVLATGCGLGRPGGRAYRGLQTLVPVERRSCARPPSLGIALRLGIECRDHHCPSLVRHPGPAKSIRSS